MNEKLTVRHFGPITEAEVEFKRVTVFIGPTGGGKSTLAKLAAIFRDAPLLYGSDETRQHRYESLINLYDLDGYAALSTTVEWEATKQVAATVSGSSISVKKLGPAPLAHFGEAPVIPPELLNDPVALQDYFAHLSPEKSAAVVAAVWAQRKRMLPKVVPTAFYVPADRAFATAVQDAAAGLQAASVALPRSLLAFIAEFEVARRRVGSLPLPFFGATYVHEDGRNQLVMPRAKRIALSQAASGLQAAVPLLVTLENRARLRAANERAACYFFVEEPELNLFPSAQRHLTEQLINACSKGQDALVINTHSPYILAHLNLLLYAHQVATQYPDRADEVAKLVPRESWIDPAEFAAYYVGDGTVRSIVSAETQLISTNELDEIAGTQADVFDSLIDISRGFPVE